MSDHESETRAAIAEAAEAAICETLGSSRYACLLLSTVGGSLAQEVFGRPYHLIVGSLQILSGGVDPETGEPAGIEMSTSDGQCFHAVFGCQHSNGKWELADISAKHYKAYAEAVPGIEWSFGEPPPYVWGFWPNAFPDYVRFVPDRDATRRQLEKLKGSEEVKDLVNKTIQVYSNIKLKRKRVIIHGNHPSRRQRPDL